VDHSRSLEYKEWWGRSWCIPRNLHHHRYIILSWWVFSHIILTCRENHLRRNSRTLPLNLSFHDLVLWNGYCKMPFKQIANNENIHCDSHSKINWYLYSLQVYWSWMLGILGSITKFEKWRYFLNMLSLCWIAGISGPPLFPAYCVEKVLRLDGKCCLGTQCKSRF